MSNQHSSTPVQNQTKFSIQTEFYDIQQRGLQLNSNSPGTYSVPVVPDIEFDLSCDEDISEFDDELRTQKWNDTDPWNKSIQEYKRVRTETESTSEEGDDYLPHQYKRQRLLSVENLETWLSGENEQLSFESAETTEEDLNTGEDRNDYPYSESTINSNCQHEEEEDGSSKTLETIEQSQEQPDQSLDSSSRNESYRAESTRSFCPEGVNELVVEGEIDTFRQLATYTQSSQISAASSVVEDARFLQVVPDLPGWNTDEEDEDNISLRSSQASFASGFLGPDDDDDDDDENDAIRILNSCDDHVVPSFNFEE